MTNSSLILVLLTTLLVSSASLEWYQQGNPNVLNWQTFNNAISEPHKYKFVKFFTHSCRYCRMLKQVEQKLMQEREWPFKFYDVDCSIDYDLCQAAVQVKSFPFVGIYNFKGQLEAKIGGYYNIDVMRDAFNNITQMQEHALKKQGTLAQIASKPQVEEKKQVPQQTHKAPEPPADLPSTETATIPTEPVNAHVEKPKMTQKAQKTKKSEKTEQWSSVTEGIKILVILFGFWMFQKQVKPYLTAFQEQEQFKSKQIEIPINGSKESAKLRDGQYYEESDSLMQDEL